MAKFKNPGNKTATHSVATRSDITSSPASGVMTTSLRPRDSFGLAKSLQNEISDNWPKSYFFPGTIVRTIVCEMHKRQTKTSEKHKFQASIAPFHYLYSTYRYFIVVKTFYEHYVVLPLWSFGRQGLRNKQSRFKEEFVGVRDHRCQGHYKNPSPRVRELVTEEMHCEDMLFPESIVWVTRPQSLFYDLPLVSRIGYLDDGSTARLIGMYNDLCLLNQQTISPFFNHYWPTEGSGDLSPAEDSIASSDGLVSRALGGLRGLWDQVLRFGNFGE